MRGCCLRGGSGSCTMQGAQAWGSCAARCRGAGSCAAGRELCPIGATFGGSSRGSSSYIVSSPVNAGRQPALNRRDERGEGTATFAASGRACRARGGERGEGAATFAASGRGEGVATGEHAALTHYGAHISPPRPPNTASRLQPSTIATRIPLLFLINFRRSLDDPDLPPHRDIGLRPVIPPRLRAWRKVRWWGSAKVICRRRGGARVFTGEVRRNTLVSHFDPTRNNDCQN